MGPSWHVHSTAGQQSVRQAPDRLVHSASSARLLRAWLWGDSTQGWTLPLRSFRFTKMKRERREAKRGHLISHGS